MAVVKKKVTTKKKAAVKKKTVVKKKRVVKKKAGRPSSLDPKLAKELCDRLIVKGSLIKVCADEDMPHKSQVYRWLLIAEGKADDDPHVIFRDQYTRARKLSKDYKFDQLNEDLEDVAYEQVYNADGEPLFRNAYDKDGIEIPGSKNPIKLITKGSMQLAKLHFDAFKWQASKEDPKKYGDKMEVEQTGVLTVNLSDKDSKA